LKASEGGIASVYEGSANSHRNVYKSYAA